MKKGYRNSPRHNPCWCGEPNYGNGLCFKHYFEKYRQEQRAKANEWDRKPKGRHCALLTAARRANVACDISQEEHQALLKQPCTYCEGPLNPTGSGLDRKDPRFGYTKDNVVPACVICNRVKNRYLTFEEMKIAMAAVIEYRRTSAAPVRKD